MPIFDHQNDRDLRIRVRDFQRIPDLGLGARFERDIRKSVCAQLGNNFAGFLHLRDTGRDAHAVERCARDARLGHHPGLAEMQIPQEPVEEHCVELCCAARLEVSNEGVFVLVEHLLRVHATPGQLSPVAGVGRRSNNLTVGRRWRHAAQDDRGQPRYF